MPCVARPQPALGCPREAIAEATDRASIERGTVAPLTNECHSFVGVKATIMKLTPLLLLLFGFQQPGFAQTYPCDAPDPIVAMYRDDADRISIAKTFQNGTTWMDSVAIDTVPAQTALAALVAVYNSTSPQRDTVVDLLDIHIYPLIPLRSFILSADTSLDWVHQLVAGNIPTGNAAIDSLMQQYDVVDVSPWNWIVDATQEFTFNTGTNWNLLPLTHLFEQIPGVQYCVANGTVGDGDRITDSVYTDHVEITYSYGWGDCPAGCGGFYHWVFTVYPDCSVVFMFGYGQSPFTTAHMAETTRTPLRVWPNPASTVMQVGGHGSKESMALYDMDGRPLGPPDFSGGGIDVRNLSAGIYFLRLTDHPGVPPSRFAVVH